MAQRHIAATVHPQESIEGVRRGLPAQGIDRIAELLAVDRSQLLQVLGISARTMQRKTRPSDRLSPAVSDRLSRIDRIYKLAVEVFGDRTKAARWLKQPSRALGEDAPLALLDTDMGTQRVERELLQIRHGFVF